MIDNYLYEIKLLKEALKESKHAVFFGGAGVSTDSGIPDFRGNGGLYSSGENMEYYLSHSCFVGEPEKFFEFYRSNMLFPDALPNRTHFALAELEKQEKIKAVITQNIDGLHQAAGSKRVIELHGTTQSYCCVHCDKKYGKDYLMTTTGIPKCTSCGATVRPEVTLYGEALDGFAFRDAANEILKVDLLIVGGSSLTVNPAASLVGNFVGKNLVIINYSDTPYNAYADIIIKSSLSQVFEELLKD